MYEKRNKQSAITENIINFIFKLSNIKKQWQTVKPPSMHTSWRYIPNGHSTHSDNFIDPLWT